MLDKTKISPSLTLKMLNGLCLLITMVLAVATFFALLEIILILAENIVVRTVDTPLRQVYTVGTVRNFWFVCGGGLLLAFLVGGFDYYSRRLGNEQTRSMLLRILALEVIIIALRIILS
jgi:hypothetical protein